MSGLRLRGGLVVDPANAHAPERRDLCVRDGRIAAARIATRRGTVSTRSLSATIIGAAITLGTISGSRSGRLRFAIAS